MNTKKLLIQLEKELDEAKQSLIIVEGKKDKQALIELGFKYIFTLNKTGKSLYKNIEIIESSSRKICILTDFDKKGKTLYLTLKSQLSQRKVKLDSKLRSTLLKLKINHIEGLSSFLRNQEIS